MNLKKKRFFCFNLWKKRNYKVDSIDKMAVMAQNGIKNSNYVIHKV